MTATFTFTLPEERDEFRTACEALEWKLAMTDLDTWLRGLLKYEHKYEDGTVALEAVLQELYEILEGYKLELHD